MLPDFVELKNLVFAIAPNYHLALQNTFLLKGASLLAQIQTLLDNILEADSVGGRILPTF